MAGIMRFGGLSTLLLLLCVLSARADILKLKDGRTFEGKIIEQDDAQLKFKTMHGSLTFKKDEILEIVEKKSAEDVMNERLLDLNPAQPAAYLDAGKWVIDEVKHEGIGLRLISLAMALDPKLFAEGQLTMGDYYYGTKNDRKKAASCYQKALLADPSNPACKERWDKVKDILKDTGSACDQKLADGLRNVLAAAFEQAQEDLESGRNSVLRPRAEEVLGGSIQDVIDYCVSKTGCKACRGTKVITCRSCKGKMEGECARCAGKGYSVIQSVNRKTYKLCSECKGWGQSLCLSCDAKRVIKFIRVGDREYGEPTVGSDAVYIPTYTLQGGTEPCRVCHGKGGRDAAPPNMQRLQQASAAIDRQLKGQLTLWEMSLTRMPRVGGPGQVDNASELLAQPVWWNGAFVAIETRRKADPNFGKSGGGGAVADAALARKGAQALVPGNDAPARFELTVRKTLGLGTTATAGAKQVFYTDFAPVPAGGSPSGGGPSVEVSDGGRRLSPRLVEIAEEFSARRIELDMGDGQGLSLAEGLSSASWGASGAVVRVYYAVVNSTDSVTPGKDKDTVVTRLAVKTLLVDVLDAEGKVVQTTK